MSPKSPRGAPCRKDPPSLAKFDRLPKDDLVAIGVIVVTASVASPFAAHALWSESVREFLLILAFFGAVAGWLHSGFVSRKNHRLQHTAKIISDYYTDNFWSKNIAEIRKVNLVNRKAVIVEIEKPDQTFVNSIDNILNYLEFLSISVMRGHLDKDFIYQALRDDFVGIRDGYIEYIKLFREPSAESSQLDINPDPEYWETFMVFCEWIEQERIRRGDR